MDLYGISRGWPARWQGWYGCRLACCKLIRPTLLLLLLLLLQIHQLNSTWSEARKASYVRHAVREYTIHKALHHRNIVSLTDIFEVGTNWLGPSNGLQQLVHMQKLPF